jgi:hypothetical protein
VSVGWGRVEGEDARDGPREQIPCECVSCRQLESWHHSDIQSPVFVNFLGKYKDGGAIVLALLAQPEVKN